MDVVGVKTGSTVTVSTHGLVEVVGSGICFGGDGVGRVDLCVRVDLILNDSDGSMTSVTFPTSSISP